VSEVTRLLASIEYGTPRATEQLLPLLYNELRRMATCKMAAEAPGHTLQPTALVHEAWLKLVDTPAQSWQNRAHFFGAAAEAMRRILISHARRENAQRRGAGVAHVDIDEIEIASPVPEDQMLALDEALTRFAAIEPKQAELVKLRYFAGLNFEEVAEILDISEATAKRWWAYSKAWLFHEINSKAE
jgi:RNA polymerase sigma factor (TIGR02999 family)